MDAMDDTTIAQAAQEEPIDESVLAGIAPVEPARPSWWDRLLTAETGSGPISAYRDHTLNFTGDDGGARLARGATGLFDNLNLAIVDLVIGSAQLLFNNWRKKPNAGA